MVDYLRIAFITVIPWIELRLSIPDGIIGTDLNPWVVFLTAVIVNIILFFPIYFGLKFAHKYLVRWKFYEKTTIRIREKGEPYVKKYGVIGLGIFIGVPLPGSGVYSGTLLAWLVGMGWRKAFLAAIIGVLIAGSIVFGLAWGFSITLDKWGWPIAGALLGIIAAIVLWRLWVVRKRKRTVVEGSAESEENA